jgi:hypothetical protein
VLKPIPLASPKIGASKRSLILRAFYATCLTLASVTHVLIDVRYGILLGGLEPLGYPRAVRLFWASLTFLDPLAALLLLARPRAGLVLCVAIMVADVLNNGWVRLHHSEFTSGVLKSSEVLSSHSRVDIDYILEVAFLLFVVATVRYAWQGLSKAQLR